MDIFFLTNFFVPKLRSALKSQWFQKTEEIGEKSYSKTCTPFSIITSRKHFETGKTS